MIKKFIKKLPFVRRLAGEKTDYADTTRFRENIEHIYKLNAEIKEYPENAKDLKEDERQYSCVIIPKIMADQNLESLNLKDGCPMAP